MNPPDVFGEASGASRASEAVAAGDSAEEEPGGPSGAAFCGARGFSGGRSMPSVITVFSIIYGVFVLGGHA